MPCLVTVTVTVTIGTTSHKSVRDKLLLAEVFVE